MKILKELFRDKKLEAELKETKEKCEFLKIEFSKLISCNKKTQNELECYEVLKVKFQKRNEEKNDFEKIKGLSKEKISLEKI